MKLQKGHSRRCDENVWIFIEHGHHANSNLLVHTRFPIILSSPENTHSPCIWNTPCTRHKRRPRATHTAHAVHAPHTHTYHGHNTAPHTPTMTDANMTRHTHTRTHPTPTHTVHTPTQHRNSQKQTNKTHAYECFRVEERIKQASSLFRSTRDVCAFTLNRKSCKLFRLLVNITCVVIHPPTQPQPHLSSSLRRTLPPESSLVQQKHREHKRKPF